MDSYAKMQQPSLTTDPRFALQDHQPARAQEVSPTEDASSEDDDASFISFLDMKQATRLQTQLKKKKGDKTIKDFEEGQLVEVKARIKALKDKKKAKKAKAELREQPVQQF